MPPKTFLFNGQQVPGQPIEVESSNEPWAQYTLADGSVLRAKLVLLEVIRLEAHMDNGDPVYQMQFQQIVGVNASEALKKKPQ